MAKRGNNRFFQILKARPGQWQQHTRLIPPREFVHTVRVELSFPEPKDEHFSDGYDSDSVERRRAFNEQTEHISEPSEHNLQDFSTFVDVLCKGLARFRKVVIVVHPLENVVTDRESTPPSWSHHSLAFKNSVSRLLRIS